MPPAGFFESKSARRQEDHAAGEWQNDLSVVVERFTVACISPSETVA